MKFRNPFATSNIRYTSFPSENYRYNPELDSIKEISEPLIVDSRNSGCMETNVISPYSRLTSQEREKLIKKRFNI